MGTICSNIESIRTVIEQKCRQAGRDHATIVLVAVTKTIPVEDIKEAIACGIDTIGENKVQEALQKYPVIGNTVTWHMIGHLQTNKVKQAVRIFDLIHSVDSLHLAQEIHNQAEKISKIQDILLEVNVSGEISKFGCDSDEAITLSREMGKFGHVRLKGLMTMAPFVADEQVKRTVFRKLSELAGKIQKMNLPNVEMNILSMGMTADFELALEEGATMVRLGTAIFGERRK